MDLEPAVEAQVAHRLPDQRVLDLVNGVAVLDLAQVVAMSMGV